MKGIAVLKVNVIRIQIQNEIFFISNIQFERCVSQVWPSIPNNCCRKCTSWNEIWENFPSFPSLSFFSSLDIHCKVTPSNTCVKCRDHSLLSNVYLYQVLVQPWSRYCKHSPSYSNNFNDRSRTGWWRKKLIENSFLFEIYF